MDRVRIRVRPKGWLVLGHRPWFDVKNNAKAVKAGLPSPAFLLTLLEFGKVRTKSKTCRARLDLVLGCEEEARHGCC